MGINVVSALLTTVLILSDTCSTCCSCAKPVRVVRGIKGLLSDSQPLDETEMQKARETKVTNQLKKNIEMQQVAQVVNNVTEVA